MGKCELCGEWFPLNLITTHLVTDHGMVELIQPNEGEDDAQSDRT
jgi:hypothetical protein